MARQSPTARRSAPRGLESVHAPHERAVAGVRVDVRAREIAVRRQIQDPRVLAGRDVILQPEAFLEQIETAIAQLDGRRHRGGFRGRLVRADARREREQRHEVEAIVRHEQVPLVE